MKKYLILPLALCSLAAHADPLGDQLVYAKNEIHAENSRFSGNTTAGGAIELRDFVVLGNLTSGTYVRFTRGTVKQGISAPGLFLEAVKSAGIMQAEGISGVAQYLRTKVDALAQQIHDLPATAVGQSLNGGLRFHARQKNEIFEVSESEFAAASNFKLRAEKGSRIVIRVRGAMANFVKKKVTVEGAIDPSRVLFYFPDAGELNFSDVQLPGSLFAPHARFLFSRGSITGQVFVSSFYGVEPCGRVYFSQSALIRDLLEFR